MSDSVTAKPESTFVCDCDQRMRSACAGEPFYKEHEGKRYCVLHFPGGAKNEHFKHAIGRKIEKQDFDFRGVWFPDPFALVRFDFGEDVNFSEAIFSAGADFSQVKFRAEANFSETTFSARADFTKAIFSGAAIFSGGTFSAMANFHSATFVGVANFTSTTFSAAVDFSLTTFNAAADFSHATLNDYVRFEGNERPRFKGVSSLDLQFARIEKPDHVSFHTLRLRPHWFVNVDARQFDFTNVDWDWRGIAEEILAVRTQSLSPDRLLAIVCRHLAVNAEENHRYEEASKFRYMAMDARRIENWLGFAPGNLRWWYWLASGYGERVMQAILVLLGILMLSAALYTRVGFARWEPKLESESDAASAKRDDVGAPLKFSRALTYSAAVMTFQKPEPRPATTAAQTIVLLETILGPVQAALLALAIRRKFMR